MRIRSSAFDDNGKIPTKYTCDGENIVPPLIFSDVPEESQTLAIVIDDPDAPDGEFTHWILYNIAPDTSEIESKKLPKDSLEAVNSWGKKTYSGPCPPSGTHHYRFMLFALDRSLSIPNSSKIEDVKKLIEVSAISHTILNGLYSKK